MHDHPQVTAFRRAATLMRDQRYWHRNDEDEIDFLEALTDVVKEVAYHLDAAGALSAQGLAAYSSTKGVHPWLDGAVAEMVLVTAVDAVREQRIATAREARNTRDSTRAST